MSTLRTTTSRTTDPARADERTTPCRPAAIEARGLRKTFGGKHALDGLDLRIERGTVYGLLGPNGAGKTTVVRTLATLIRPSGGSARVLGHDVVADANLVRRKIGLTGQYASVDEDLTGRENLILVGRLLGMRRGVAKVRADELLDAFGLSEAANRRVRTYSGGMRRRLDIATSIIVTPEILFLDEPTTGLDPRSRNRVWDIVRAIAAGGTTVLLTTQYLEEADRLADRLAVIDHGRIIAEGTRDELKALVGADTLQVRVRNPDDRERARMVLSERLGPGHVPGRDPAEIRGPAAPELVATAIDDLLRARIPIAGYSVGPPSLDEVFLTLTESPTEAVA